MYLNVLQNQFDFVVDSIKNQFKMVSDSMKNRPSVVSETILEHSVSILESKAAQRV